MDVLRGHNNWLIGGVLFTATPDTADNEAWLYRVPGGIPELDTGHSILSVHGGTLAELLVRIVEGSDRLIDSKSSTVGKCLEPSEVEVCARSTLRPLHKILIVEDLLGVVAVWGSILLGVTLLLPRSPLTVRLTRPCLA